MSKCQNVKMSKFHKMLAAKVTQINVLLSKNGNSEKSEKIAFESLSNRFRNALRTGPHGSSFSARERGPPYTAKGRLNPSA